MITKQGNLEAYSVIVPFCIYLRNDGPVHLCSYLHNGGPARHIRENKTFAIAFLAATYKEFHRLIIKLI